MKRSSSGATALNRRYATRIVADIRELYEEMGGTTLLEQGMWAAIEKQGADIVGHLLSAYVHEVRRAAARRSQGNRNARKSGRSKCDRGRGRTSSS